MIASILMLFGGLGAFLAGMKLISYYSEAIAGGKIEEIFSRLSDNKIASIGIGVGSSAILQSSSATTVILIGLVNAGIVSLFQATCIIMGANIGTTFTAIIMSLNSLPISEVCAFLTFVGIMVVMAGRKSMTRTIGWIITSVGLIFIGLDIIKDSANALNESEALTRIFTSINSPVMLLLIGAIFTAIIQSSSATTGMLIPLATLGIMPVVSTFYIIMGSNVGSCMTAIISAMGGSVNAKRTAVIHFIFNAIGVVIFLPIVIIFNVKIEQFKAYISPSALIAYFHVVFNLFTTIILVPFIKRIVALAIKLVPEEKPVLSSRCE